MSRLTNCAPSTYLPRQKERYTNALSARRFCRRRTPMDYNVSFRPFVARFLSCSPESSPQRNYDVRGEPADVSDVANSSGNAEGELVTASSTQA